MGLTLMFGLPLSILPCREAFLSLIQQLGRFWNDSREPANIVEDSEADASIVMTPDTTLLTRKSMETSYSSFASAEIDVKSDIDNVERSSTGSLPSFTSTELVPGLDVEKNEEHELQPDVNPHDRNTAVHVGTTIAMTIFSFFGAVSVPGVAVVWCILGSSLGMFIAFIFPCACYLKIRGGKGMGRRTNAGALALLIFSIVISVVCTTQTILGILSKDD
jgi:amino acid permease